MTFAKVPLRIKYNQQSLEPIKIEFCQNLESQHKDCPYYGVFDFQNVFENHLAKSFYYSSDELMKWGKLYEAFR